MFKKVNHQNKDISIYGIIDERTKAIVYQGDAYTGRFMLFAILLDVVIRGLALSNPITSSNWDLMLIVIIGGFISTAFQIKNKVILNRPFSRKFIPIALLFGFCTIIAFIVAYILSE